MDIKTLKTKLESNRVDVVNAIEQFTKEFKKQFLADKHLSSKYNIVESAFRNNANGIGSDFYIITKDGKTTLQIFVGFSPNMVDACGDNAFGIAFYGVDYSNLFSDCCYCKDGSEFWSFFGLPILLDRDTCIKICVKLGVRLLRKILKRIIKWKKSPQSDCKSNSKTCCILDFISVIALLFVEAAAVVVTICFSPHDKTSSAAYMISFFVILLSVIICFTVFSIKLIHHILRNNKLNLLREIYGELSNCICPCCCADKTLTKTTTDVSGNTKTTEEYYPSGKAAVDLYKAYSSAVVDV